MMNISTYFKITLCLFLIPFAMIACSNAPSTEGQVPDRYLKAKKIKMEDKYAVVEEDRIRGVSSEYRVTSKGGGGYNLVSSHGSQAKEQSAHRDPNEMMLPSWKLFTW